MKSTINIDIKVTEDPNIAWARDEMWMLTEGYREFSRINTPHHCEGIEGPCENTEITQQDCRTQYADPSQNRSPWLCAECAQAYHDYWDEMWANYNRGRL